jgi:hypothetical protein
VSDLRFLERLGAEFARISDGHPTDPRSRARHSPWRGTVSGALRTLGLAGSALVTAVVLAVVLVSAANHATDRVNGPAGTAEQGYVNASIAAVAKRDRGCNTLVEGQTSQGTPTSLLPLLAVLRRPAGPEDSFAMPQSTPSSRSLPGGLTGGRPGGRSLLDAAEDDGAVYVNYARQARVVRGFSYNVIPVLTGTRAPVPARCIAEQRQQLLSTLTEVPTSQRRATLSLAARSFNGERDIVNAREALELLETNGNGDASSSSTTASEVAAEQGPGALTINGCARAVRTLSCTTNRHPDHARARILSFVVTDRVASVTLSSTARRRNTRPVTARPIGNVVVISVPMTLAGG